MRTNHRDRRNIILEVITLDGKEWLLPIEVEALACGDFLWIGHI